MSEPTRTQKVVAMLHGAGVDGVTARDIAGELDLRVYDTKRILASLVKGRRATIISARRRGQFDDHLDEVFACRCPLVDQHQRSPDVDDDEGRRFYVSLDDDTRERGHAGVAAARAALAEAKDRRRTA